MSVTLITALLLQAAAIILLRLRLGKLWLRRPTALVVLASTVYQGASAILLAFPSVRAWDDFRTGVQQSYTDDATLLISTGMLAFAIAYLLTAPARDGTAASAGDIHAAAGVLDWRWLAIACLPLAVLTYTGRGYNNGVNMGADTAAGTKLASTFFIILVLLAAFGLVLRQGPQWFLPVLAGQSVLLAAAGERSPVVMDAIALAVMLAYAGLRPSRGQVRASAGIAVIAILAITGVRAEQGRHLYYSDSGLGARLSALTDALPGLASGHGSPGLISQAADRFDGDAFAGAVWQASALGYPRLSAVGIPESLLVLVPSEAWPSKFAHAAALNPFGEQLDDLGLKDVNFLPGFPGLYMGLLSPPRLVAFLALCGLLCGAGERWLFRRCSAVRLVLLAGAVTGALSYEKGLPGMLVALRAAVLIAGAVKVAEVLHARRHVRGHVVTEIGHRLYLTGHRPGQSLTGRRHWPSRPTY
jgi:hypothetical protein